MEKRRKNLSTEFSSEYDTETGMTSEEEYKKMRSLSPTTIIMSFIGLIVMIYLLYIIFYGSGQNSSMLSLNIPSIREDSVLSIQNIIHSSNMNEKQTFVTIETIKPSETNQPSEEELQKVVTTILDQLREIKASGRAIETDPEAKILVQSVQGELRKLIPIRYGSGPYFIEMKLQFPQSMPDYDVEGPDGTLIIELGPIELVPYSIFYFMEVARQWKGGAFHRRAGHVLQAMVYKSRNIRGLAFQEYHPDFPHKVLTLGYAGRPGGPEFYISIMDNVENHGPGSQGSKTEADSCFGKILIGERVIERMKKQPGATPPMGFVNDDKHLILIPTVRILKRDEIPEI